MNKVNLMGRLTRDPEIRTSGETTVGSFTLAVDRRIKKEGQPSADFIRCTAFGKSAEFAEKYLKKGTKIALTGRIQTGSYQDKNGNTVYTTDVVIEEMEFAESKNSQGDNASQSASQQQTSRPTPSEARDGFMNIPDGIDEELPFV